MLFDQYIGHSFHISPGVVLYDGNQATGNATLPTGQTFTLNNTQYYSAAANAATGATPATGTGSFTSGKIAPEILFGFGNMLPRSANKHFSVSLEAGAIFTQKPVIALGLSGYACVTSPTVGCANIATTSTIQANLQAEQTKLNSQASSYIKYWPILRLGFGYKF